VLRHEHWRMSQLSENVASEPVQLELCFSSVTMPSTEKKKQNRKAKD
jgi:hypothetical protein